MQAILYAITVLQAVPNMIAAGRNIAAFVEKHSAVLKAMQSEGRAPTTEEWATLNVEIDELRKALRA